MKKSGGLGIALLGLILLVWLASQMSFREVDVPAPLRGEAASNPFYAAVLFSRTLGADADWQQMFTVPPPDSVLVLSGWHWTLSRARRARIEAWVQAGGRLVVDAWMLGETGEFERWSGVARREIAEPDFDEPDVPCTALTEDGTGRRLEVCASDPFNTLATTRDIAWALRKGDRIDALRVAVGKGSVTVVNAEPFRHRAFLQGDHMLLFLAATQLHRNDAVTFLTEEDQASLLTLVWRFGAPAVLLLLAAVLIALWRAGVRFGPPVAATDSARRSLAEQIRGTGQFVLRFGGGHALHAAANRALHETARRRLHDYDRMSGEARVVALAAATGLGADDLRHAMNFPGERNSHELRHALATLETARRRLH